MRFFELKYIDIESSYYKEGVKLREELFFKYLENSHNLIQDKFELNALHLVCLDKDKVIGTGRLNFENDISIISQMAVKINYQKQGVGAKILNELVKFSKEKGIFKIKLSARETALAFYEKFNFELKGDKYLSKKTGIIHQQMVLKTE